MKPVLNTIRFFAATLSVGILFSDCKKDTARSNNAIQQGNTTIEINAIYTGTPGGSSHFLQVRYNNVIDAPINVTVTLYLKNGQQKNIPVTIPAGYRHLQSWGDDKYFNTLDYAWSGELSSIFTFMGFN